MTRLTPQKILLIRLDRMGDLILTLPADEALLEAQHKVDWWIPKGLSFIGQNALPARPAREVAAKINFKNFLRLLSSVRKESYSAAVVFHAPWWVGALLWLARIPQRVGVKSQWHSYIFFNRGLRQKRSLVQMHELDYNLELIAKGLGANFQLDIPKLAKGLTLKAPGSVPPLLALSLADADLPSDYFVVHAGMGGSALNWPTNHYISLIEKIKRQAPVVLTGTEADETYLAPLKSHFQNDKQIIFLDGKLSGPELLNVLENALTVVAPSTGVLHLAASLQVPTIGLFSPVLVQSSRRWGPKGAGAVAFAPQVDCPARLECLGLNCPHFNCMGALSPELVEAEIKKQFRKKL